MLTIVRTENNIIRMKNRQFFYLSLHHLCNHFKIMMSLVQENKSLKSYNTFGIDVIARYFAEIRSIEDLQEIFASSVVRQPLLVLGGGSNVLFTKDFEGLVLKISIPGIEAEVIGEDVLVHAGAGVIWHDLVVYCVEHGYAGLENLSLIPGTVGASPIQNIGAYGVELKDVFHSCDAFEIASGQLRTFRYADCHFDYRDSIFKGELRGKYIVTSVTFKLNTVPAIQTQYGAIQAELAERGINDPSIADISNVVSQIRVSKLPDPSTIGNAGSFFKNPIIPIAQFDRLLAQFPDIVHYAVGSNHVKLAAGWLIEQCGYKGKVEGNTGTWKNQALVLVNHGGASGKEVYSFSERIIQAVKSRFGIYLEREVNIM
jgi:UDP-N-acetylmuramate dehydrogenase